MSSSEVNSGHQRNHTKDTLSPVKEILDQEDAMTIYSDFLTDWDTPAKIPNFEPKTHLQR